MKTRKLYVLSVAWIALGCGSPNKEAEPAKAPSMANVASSETPQPSSAAAPAVKVGDTIKCPVSGEEFTVADNSPKVTHEGRDYYFCCASCAESFKADPKKYIK